MNTNILNPQALFQLPVRYTIPPFQRHYVWTQEGQWEPLWEDVRNIAENYLEKLAAGGNNALMAQQQTNPHFLGAIVLQQVPIAVGEIARWEVIDGQQRLTTLQLLLDAVQFVLEERRIKQPATRLAKLVLNDRDLVGEDGTHIFKLWPTITDRDAFRHAMDNGLAVNEHENSLIVQAHEFFQQEVRHWLGEAEESVQRVAALETALTAMLNLVVIDLNQYEDPNVIFETLNARGTPLEQSALIRNFVLSRRPDDEEWQEVWNDLNDRWWLQEVQQGRLHRPRIDMVSNYWLAMKTGREVTAPRVYTTFRTFIQDKRIEEVMQEVKRDLANYRRFQQSPCTKRDEQFQYRTGVMEAGVITPVLLKLLRAESEVRERAFRALESFLIRRMICRMTTNHYNRLMLELCVKLEDAPLGQADKVIARFLREQDAYSTEWPEDKTVSDSLLWSPVYRRLTRGRLRLVLEGIESALRTPMSETGDVPRDLTIEHLMPVSWSKEKWPLPACVDEEEASEARNGRIHTIGNLTLVTGRLNSKLSNAPWCQKREAIQKHAVLNLNGELVTKSAWDEDSIRARSQQMAQLIAKCWPGPDSNVWGV